MTTPLAPIRSIPAFAVIIRAMHERGPSQAEAIRELHLRGLWLADEQIAATGLPRDEYDAIYRGRVPIYSPDADKSRDPRHMGGRVRYDAVVRDEHGRRVFSVGFFRGRNAKARALDKARECAARKARTGEWLEPRP